MNSLGEFPVEDSHRCQRHMHKPVSARLLHQLSEAASAIDMNDHERTGFSGDTDQVTGSRNSSGKKI